MRTIFKKRLGTITLEVIQPPHHYKITDLSKNFGVQSFRVSAFYELQLFGTGAKDFLGFQLSMRTHAPARVLLSFDRTAHVHIFQGKIQFSFGRVFRFGGHITFLKHMQPKGGKCHTTISNCDHLNNILFLELLLSILLFSQFVWIFRYLKHSQ